MIKFFIKIRQKLLTENKFGMAVYTPICNNFLAGMAGNRGGEAESSSTSHIAPVESIKLHKNTVYEYNYYLLIRDLNEIRSIVYRLNKQFNLYLILVGLASHSTIYS